MSLVCELHQCGRHWFYGVQHLKIILRILKKNMSKKVRFLKVGQTSFRPRCIVDNVGARF